MLDNGERIKLIATALGGFKRPIKQRNVCQVLGDGKNMVAPKEGEAGQGAMKTHAHSPRPFCDDG